ncbi:MAG: glycosyltransferase family 61 protein [Pontimonas sp.]
MDRLLRGLYGFLAWVLSTPVGKFLIPPRFRLVTITTSPSPGSVESGEFFAPSAAVVSRCQELGRDFVTPDPEQFPAVGWSVWDNVEVTNNRYFPYLLSSDQLMLGPRRLPGPYKVVAKRNRILWARGDKALVNRKHGERMRIEKGIFLGGRDFTNWYHWLVDGLPALHLANSLPDHLRDWPVLVPEQIYRYPTMIDALDLFRARRDVIVMPEWAMVSARKLVWIDPLEVSNIPKTGAHTDKEPRIHLLHREGMESYRDEYLKAFAPESITPHRRIVLAREGGRRSYNQEEVLAIAADYGFEPVYPEKLSLAEQVRTFREASHVLGPSGAGFAGMLFAQSGTSALCWQDTRLRFMTILPDLATLNGAEYWHIFYQSHEDNGLFRSSYTLDETWLRESLDTWLR